jgi:hypothetical protein
MIFFPILTNGAQGHYVQVVQTVQAVQNPTSFLPRGRGGGQRRGVERSEVVEQLDRLEL